MFFPSGPEVPCPGYTFAQQTHLSQPAHSARRLPSALDFCPCHDLSPPRMATGKLTHKSTVTTLGCLANRVGQVALVQRHRVDVGVG